MEQKTEIITVRAYDLVKYALPVLNKLPRDQKFLFGDRVHNHLLDLLEALVETTYLPPAAKRPVLTAVNLRLEKLRFLFRLGFEMGYFSMGQYSELSRRTDEIGRMAGGWLRSLKN